MNFTKKVSYVILAAALMVVVFGSCRRGQGCPKFSVEISQNR